MRDGGDLSINFFNIFQANKTLFYSIFIKTSIFLVNYSKLLTLYLKYVLIIILYLIEFIYGECFKESIKGEKRTRID